MAATEAEAKAVVAAAVDGFVSAPTLGSGGTGTAPAARKRRRRDGAATTRAQRRLAVPFAQAVEAAKTLVATKPGSESLVLREILARLGSSEAEPDHAKALALLDALFRSLKPVRRAVCGSGLRALLQTINTLSSSGPRTARDAARMVQAWSTDYAAKHAELLSAAASVARLIPPTPTASSTTSAARGESIPALVRGFRVHFDGTDAADESTTTNILDVLATTESTLQEIATCMEILFPLHDVVASGGGGSADGVEWESDPEDEDDDDNDDDGDEEEDLATRVARATADLPSSTTVQTTVVTPDDAVRTTLRDARRVLERTSLPALTRWTLAMDESPTSFPLSHAQRIKSLLEAVRHADAQCDRVL